MLATNKWRLLTIVAGLLLAHAIDSPLANPSRALTQQQQVVTLHQFNPAAVGINADARSSITRNLYPPNDVFSKVDNVRFTTDKRVSRNQVERQTFGSFRYSNGASRRRSDNIHVVNSSLAVQGGGAPHSRRTKPKSQYSFIPLGQFNEPDAQSTGLTQRANDHHPTNATLLDGIQSRTDTNVFGGESTSSRSKIIFPSDAPISNTQHDITGRRSGIQFAAQSQKLETPFQPQGYREDNPSSPNYQFPYIEELSVGGLEPDTRYARGVTFEQSRVPSTIQQQLAGNSQIAFRDDVTKFGDNNGPITSMQHRKYYDFSDNKPFTSRPFDANAGYYTSSYDEFSRSPRFNSPPPNTFVEYSDYPGPPRSRLITPWKSSRTPRVVFPQNTGEGASFPTGTAAGTTSGVTYGTDNVVFR